MNRTELWELRDKGPGLQPSQLFYAIKAALEDGLRASEFDFLAFEKGCVELIDVLIDSVDNLLCGPLERQPSEIATKITFLLIFLVHTFGGKDPEKQFAYKWHVTHLGKALNQWLLMNGSAGREACMPNPETMTYPLRLGPELVGVLHTIVNRQGLMESVFTPEQIWGLGGSVKVTEYIGENVRKAWSAHKNKKHARVDAIYRVGVVSIQASRNWK